MRKDTSHAMMLTFCIINLIYTDLFLEIPSTWRTELRLFINSDWKFDGISALLILILRFFKKYNKRNSNVSNEPDLMALKNLWILKILHTSFFNLQSKKLHQHPALADKILNMHSQMNFLLNIIYNWKQHGSNSLLYLS